MIFFFHTQLSKMSFSQKNASIHYICIENKKTLAREKNRFIVEAIESQAIAMKPLICSPQRASV